MPTVSMDQLVDAICNLTLLEAAELTKTLEDKLGVSAAAPMMAMAPGAAAVAAPVEEEKTTFDVELTSLKPEANKVQVIKVVREFTTLGLKEAKELVDGAPKVVKEGTTKEDADKMKARFEEVHAVITIK